MDTSFERSESGKEEWLTPPELIEKLGPFDLDPCSPVASVRPWPTARVHYTIEDDGLTKPWVGLVFCNPPYGKKTGQWLKMCSAHDTIALVFAGTETQAFHRHVWPAATSFRFIEGRLRFWELVCSRCGVTISKHIEPDGTEEEPECWPPIPSNVAIEGGTAGSPSVLIAYGDMASNRIKECRVDGYFLMND